MKKTKLKKVFASLVLGAMLVGSILSGGTSASAEIFFEKETNKYSHLVEKYTSEDNSYAFNNVYYSKAETEKDKKRRPDNWNYVFKYYTKDGDGKTRVEFNVISQKYWKVSNKGEPKEGVEYVLVMKYNMNPIKGEPRLQNIDAIEYKAKTDTPTKPSKPSGDKTNTGGSSVLNDGCKTSFKYSKLNKKLVKVEKCD